MPHRQKTYSFLVGYLLGVDERSLQKNFYEEYTRSNGLENFKDVPNAFFLRNLSIVKQSFLRNHIFYRNVVNLEEAAKGYIDKELVVIKENGLDLAALLYETGDIYALISKVQDYVELLYPDVLAYLNVPYIKQISNLFYLREVDRQSITQLVGFLRSDDNWSILPYGIIIDRYKKVIKDLPYTFYNDKNLFYISHLLGGEMHTGNPDDFVIPEFSWDTIGQSAQVEVTATEDVYDSDRWGNIAEGSVMYVDCDNMDIINFLVMLDLIEQYSNEGTEHKVKLFIDPQTSPVWSYLEKVKPTGFVYESYNVPRVKDEKSMVDMAMAVHVMEDVLQNNVTNVGIISSDSDFYALIDTVKNVNFFVGYNQANTNREYINTLDEKGVMSFNILNLDMKGISKDFLTSLLAVCVLDRMSQIPLTDFTFPVLSEWLSIFLNTRANLHIEVEREFSDKVVQDVLDGLQITTVDGKLKLTSLGYEIEVPLK